MAISTKHVTSLVELSQRRDEPKSADLQRSLHLARTFEADPSTPIAFRSLTWHVITDSHAAAGWEMPDGERFPACCGAAASAQHGCALLIQDVAEQAESVSGPVLLLGALAASRSIFGDWNILPTSGAFLVPLTADSGDLPPASLYRSSVGVKWGAPGDLRNLFTKHSTAVELAGLEVLIPAPELITARTAGCAHEPASLECLIFLGAAHAAVHAGAWDDALRIAPQLGKHNKPLDTACRLGIDRWLGLGVSAPRRAYLALKRILGNNRAA
jgi:hypothetical protein